MNIASPKPALSTKWPAWEALSQAVKARINNGIGPDWLPDFARKALTKLGGTFFVEADWAHHDYGYMKGGNGSQRRRCDRLFLQAMLSDAARLSPFKRALATGLAASFWTLVRLFGWASFAWGPQRPPAWVFA